MLEVHPMIWVFSSKWKVPCSREVSLFREAVVFVHETVFRVIVCFPAL